ncbi:hypothetical protein SE17_32460 [Kouleothrix aurantiaca]|uniref:Uncharacterized protein n=1 Tax=Kouleothrix aurantiaca TaxID=186479 RepID=A0A0P9CUZ2_9CHLR|nr:hypothetical protein SE17_32460 [Kouleothrix aurantiaca]
MAGQACHQLAFRSQLFNCSKFAVGGRHVHFPRYSAFFASARVVNRSANRYSQDFAQRGVHV